MGPACAGMTVEGTVEKYPCVYILASGRAGTLYTGVTSDLMGRLYKHREGITKGFAHEHGALRLVWYEMHGDMEAAILREKRIKKWNRDWKLNLIEQSNPEWVDLAIGLGFEPLPIV
ncbi:GIY-YIG nuclease family protein [Sphingomonas sp. HITSZ_GF]|uniref:GIY-YIG nuclease family protein n=1 Tax=Sphingomonas sp. HITSZ_GF TaxID=3037247 RepID=UPI00240DC12D|nr:GIY-YIG nuclease family protein [Sphingomonas sp. HITSZ_GF]MDG2534362.1 GIY-YIG nuclease family protein [Sphingomonas sp. HITSZ_GF]